MLKLNQNGKVKFFDDKRRNEINVLSITRTELVTEIKRPEKDLNEIRRSKKQLEDQFSSLKEVDEDLEREC